MTKDELIKQAKFYNEAIEIKQKRPRLIAASNKRIQQLKKEIKELELEDSNQLKNELNPKKFFFKKNKEIDTSELILKKEIEIRSEESKIQSLEATRLKDVIDINEVVDEANEIIRKQKKSLDKQVQDIARAREEYHNAVKEYENSIVPVILFRKHVDSNIDLIERDGFVPEHQGDKSYRQRKKIDRISVDERIIKEHQRTILSPHAGKFVDYVDWS